MNILFICDYYDDTQLYQEPMLAKYYHYLGHKVSVITSHHQDVFKYTGEKAAGKKLQQKSSGKYGETIYRLPYALNVMNKVKKFPDISALLSETEPDIVFMHDISFNLHEIVKYKNKIKKCRIIMDYHADYSNSGKNWLSIKILHQVIRKKYLQFYLKHISKIFPIVPDGIKFLNEIYGIKPERMELLPLGVDALAMDELREQMPEYRAFITSKLKIPKDAVLLVSGGKLDEVKKTDLLLKTMKFLPENTHLLLFGKATTETYDLYLKKLSEKVHVHFLGWLSAEETLKLFLLSDIAVFPASQSVLWQQAIGAGLPLVVGNSGSQSAEYMNKNNNITVIEKENLNVSAFSEILNKLILDEDLRKEMAAGAKRTAETYLDYKIIAEKTLEI